MRQVTLSVTLEVEPDSCAQLSTLIDDLKKQEESAPFGVPESYDRLKTAVPTAHFMSISVFPGADYDPLLVIEANFDGEPGVFWGQVEAALGTQLRPMLRCCKRPRDESGPLFDAVTATGSRALIAPYLEARTLQPSVFHHGNRGMSRDRILRECALFAAIREELAQSNAGGASPYRGTSAEQIHERLRHALLPGHSWLAGREAPRIPIGERIGDFARLAVFAWAALIVLSVPGLVLAPFMPTPRFLILFAILAVLILAQLLRNRAPQPGTAAPRESGGTAYAPLLFWVGLLAVIYILVTAPIFALIAVPLTGARFEQALEPAARMVGLGLVSLLFTLPALSLWLRWLERRDSAQDGPPVNERLIREMAQREDWIPQNHMGSIVLVKPGVLRTILVHAGHRALGLALRVIATDGYLGSMRTVHFAHWAFINNGSRLMFFSNFDHSWESYLDDFIEKAHAGLTLAWGSSVGFPPARFLVLDGASHGRKFKNWARHSMAVSRFWYSAYRDLTVDQIERNARIADGLRKERLTGKGAEAWAMDL
jgi:membrane protein implicated in regulation of membrane protease activity